MDGHSANMDGATAYGKPIRRSIGYGRILHGPRHLGLIVLGILLTFYVIHTVQIATAAVGDLDPTFGNGGLAVGQRFIPLAMMLQPDDQIVVSGQNEDSGMYGLVRYNTNGTVDPAFGDNGFASIGYPYPPSVVAFQPDGKILIAGHDFLMRLNSTGSLDASFGSSGIILAPLGAACGAVAGDCTIAALAVDANDKIVASGSYGYTLGRFWISDFAVARFSSSGSPDVSFNGTGVALTNFESEDRAAAVLLQSDGKIVAVGTASPEPAAGLRFALARYNANGSLDSSFGQNGQVVTTPGGVWASAENALLQPDGKIIVVGSSWANPSFVSTLARYDVHGNLDPSFGSGGIITNTAMSTAMAAVIQRDGKLIVLNGGFNLTRYWPNGQIDSTFGNGGIIGEPTDHVQNAVGVALQPDGKFVVAGTQLSGASPAYTHDALIARYQNKLMNVHQTVTTLSPEAGQLITYTFTLENADPLTTTQVVISDSLPAEITWASRLQMDPPLSGTIGQPPSLVSDLTLAPWQTITLTFPVTVNLGLANGTVISNVITVVSAQTATPITASLVITTPGPPFAVPDYALTSKNTPVHVDVLGNDWDPNNDPLTLVNVGAPLSGTTSLGGTDITYTPALGFFGYDTFTYTVSDRRFNSQGVVYVSVPDIMLKWYVPVILYKK